MRIFFAHLVLIGFGTTLLTADQHIATTDLHDAPADPAAEMVAGIDRFLLAKLAEANEKQSGHWRESEQFDENRDFLIERLGLESMRHPIADGLLRETEPIASCESLTIDRVRWPVLSHPAPQTSDSIGLWGEGIHLRPSKSIGKLLVIIPDADENPEDWLPESVAGSNAGPIWRQTDPARLAAAGVDVIVLATVSREIHQHGHAKMSRREYLHRSAFELGRTLLGYEVQMVQAILDRFPSHQSIVCGVGEGGLIALMTGAVDQRIDEVAIGSYLGTRREVWKEPLSRQIFGLSNRIDDGHLLALNAPTHCIVFTDKVYSVELLGGGGAPANWKTPSLSGQVNPFKRCEAACLRAGIDHPWTNTQANPPLENASRVLEGLDWAMTERDLAPSSSDPQRIKVRSDRVNDRLFDSIDAYNQLLLAESEYERREYLNVGNVREDRKDGANRVDTSSSDAYRQSIERFRTDFRENVIGWFDDELLKPNARSEQSMKGTNWTGHDVYLDVFPDVFAYGVLLVPNDLKPDEKRPVVVCQHGLEGRPMDTIAGDHRAYHDFAAKLAEKGFVVFAPQNPYIGKDKFRTLQRKAYPIGKTLFSIIGAQHQQIIRYLKTVPGVDPNRIAFYGLSYGGKSAMRLPALLPEYCLSICSADFNDWVWKNASSRSRYSYVGTGEYEIFEFGLGKKFNYAEMAALIAPRPFMVERGHHDGVAPDWRVASEFAKVRYLYQARLKFPPGQCEIEFFDGPHTINGKGTFEFLQRHLNYPAR